MAEAGGGWSRSKGGRAWRADVVTVGRRCCGWYARSGGQLPRKGGGFGAGGGGDALDLTQAQAGGGRGAGGCGGPVLLLTELGAGGHFGSGAAGTRLRDRAVRFAFLLHVLGGSDSGGGGSGSGGGVDSGSGGGGGTVNALHV